MLVMVLNGYRIDRLLAQSNSNFSNNVDQGLNLVVGNKAGGSRYGG